MKVLIAIVSLMAFLALASQAQALQFYADLQGGLSLPTGASMSSVFHDNDGPVQLNGCWKTPGYQGNTGKFGINAGWWFNDNPASLLSHFGGNFNFSYNRLDFQKSTSDFTATVAPLPHLPNFNFKDILHGAVDFNSRGHLFSLAYLFNYRQTLGPLELYGGLGPAIFINKQQFSRTNYFISNDSGKSVAEATPTKQGFGIQTDTSVGLMVQVGVKYFLTKNVYTNLSFDYRYFRSNFELAGVGITHDNPGKFSSALNYSNNLFGINFGAGFQF